MNDSLHNPPHRAIRTLIHLLIAIWAIAGGPDAATAAGPLNPDVSVHGENGQFLFLGDKIEEAGDVNGDGYSDFVVRDRFAEKLRLYYGSYDGPDGSSFTTIVAPSVLWASVQGFAASFAAGDADGDGFSDLLVGAPATDYYGGTDVGMVFVFRGSSGGISTTPSHHIDGPQNATQLGIEIYPAGDVNGDGKADFVIGERSGATNWAYRTFLGGPGNLVEDALIHTGLSGIMCDMAGDVDGDGYDDVVLGDPNVYHGSGSAGGSAYLFYGSPSGITASPGWEYFNSDTMHYQLGRVVSGPGDVDGDGYADILVSDYGYRVVQGTVQQRGRVFLFRGGPSGPSTAPFWVATGEPGDSYLGFALSPAGDTNGDGYADFLVTSRPSEFTSRVNLYLGSRSSIPSAGQSWRQLDDDSIYNIRIAPAGDVDGDGFGDWLIGRPEGPSYGTAEVFLGRGHLPSTTAVASVAGSHSHGLMGRSMSADGDANLDGISDLLIGIPGRAGLRGITGAGGVTLYYGSNTGVVDSGWSRMGSATDDSLGTAVAFVGDTNGDNAGEFAVSAPYSNGGGTVSLYSASSSGPSTIAYRTLNGTQAGERFGHSIAGFGDVDGDGYADLAVGSPSWDGTTADRGRVQVFMGSSTGLSVTAAWEYSRGGMTGTQCVFGDFNRDGYSDLAVSSPSYQTGRTTPMAGTVDIFYGSSSGLSASPGRILVNDEAWSRFGSTVAAVGDINGDGFEDLSVAATHHGYASLGIKRGRVYLYYGASSGLSAFATWWRDGSTLPDEQYGISIAGTGDVDGDGFDDFAIGSLAEYVDLFRGNAGVTVSSIPDATFIDSSTGTEFGRTIAGRGHCDSDPFADFFVGRPLSDLLYADAGGARLYRGGTADITNLPLGGLARQIGSTTSLARLGRSATSSVNVQTTLRSPAGATDLRLQTRHTDLFSEIITPIPAYSGNWVHARSSNASAVLGGMQTLTPHHWQVRTVTRNTRFPTSPWRTLAGGSPNLTHFRTGGVVERPDLVVQAALADSGSTVAPFVFEVRIANQGVGPAGGSHTRIAVDGTVYCDLIPTSSLTSGSNTTVSCNFGTLDLGPHTVTVTVDAGSELIESNESNNVSSFTIYISGPDYLLVRQDGTGDVPTLADALAAIDPGGVVELANGTFTGPGNYGLNPGGKILTIRSQSGDPAACIINPQGTSASPRRVLHLNSGETSAFTIRGIGFAGAYQTGSGGAIRIDASSMTIENCRFENNFAGSGGGLYGLNSPGVIFRNCEFIDNEVTNAGAGVYLNNTPGTFDRCRFVANLSEWGGALYSQSAPMTISGSLFANNVNPHYGGALEINQPGAVVDVDQTTFYGNGSPHAAHVFVRNGATLNLHRSILSGGVEGVPVGCAGGSEVVTMSCSDVWGNSAGDYVGCLSGLQSTSDNFSSNPYFCDAGTGDFSLGGGSECIPENSPCGTRVGAFDLVCAAVGTEEVPVAYRFELGGAVPNPFNPRTEIRFEVEKPGPVDLTIHDVAGRRVRTLLRHESVPGGPNRIIWDGTDDRDRQVASGIYFVRLRSGARSATTKVALVR